MSQFRNSIECWNNLGQNFWNGRSVRQRWLHQFVLFPALLAQIKEIPHTTILDFGCGDGTLTTFLSKELPESNVVAYDASKEMRENAKAILGSDNVIDNLDKKTFDLICSNMVIQDIEDPTDALSDLKHHLNNEGRVLITLPHPAFSLYEQDHLTTKHISVTPSGQTGVHRYLFEEAEKVFWDLDVGQNWTYLFNKTIQSYSNYFFRAGFVIELITEPMPINEGRCEEDLYEINTKLPRTILFRLRA